MITKSVTIHSYKLQQCMPTTAFHEYKGILKVRKNYGKFVMHNPSEDYWQSCVTLGVSMYSQYLAIRIIFG